MGIKPGLIWKGHSVDRKVFKFPLAQQDPFLIGEPCWFVIGQQPFTLFKGHKSYLQTCVGYGNTTVTQTETQKNVWISSFHSFYIWYLPYRDVMAGKSLCHENKPSKRAFKAAENMYILSAKLGPSLTQQHVAPPGLYQPAHGLAASNLFHDVGHSVNFNFWIIVFLQG